MEQQIQDLVSSIKKEGIDEAKKQADEILKTARAEADRLIADAKKQSEKLIADAESGCVLREKSSKAAIEQAARDVSLSLRKSINDELERILSADIAKSMDAALLSKLVAEAVKAGFSDAVVEVGGADAAAIVKSLSGQFAAELKSGLVLKAGSASDSGIKVTASDGSGYIDLSAEECTKLLRPYLSSALKEYIGL